MNGSSRTITGGFALVAMLALGFRMGAPAEPAGETGATRADWPQWRGPHRNGVGADRGLLASWPEKGPTLLWTAGGLGRGYSSPIVVGKTIYITGDVEEHLVIFALDLTGHERWRATNGALWKNPWPGARSACTFDAGRLYHMNAHGRLAAFDAETGKELWAVDVLERFRARNVTWGRSESVLVDGRKLLVTAAGEGALVAALDKETGATIWSSPPLAEEKPSYASPILVAAGGRRVFVNTGSRHAFGVDAETGELLWTHRHPVEENVLGSTPLYFDNSVFITNSSREESTLYRLRLSESGKGVSRAWSSGVKNGQGGLVELGGRIFCGNGAAGDGVVAVVQPETGITKAVGGSLTFGSVACADGHMYYLGQLGDAALLRPTADGAVLAGRFRLVEPRRKDAWAHPVISRGVLYLRYHETLHAYDVRK